MPIYEYECAKCESQFEVEQRITADPVKTCPKCRSRRVKRLISKTSFVLKGGGWYSDLYASSGGKKDKDDSSGDKKGSESESESKSKDESKSTTESKDSGGGGDKKSKDKKPKGKGKNASKAGS